MPKVQVDGFQCTRCGHVWVPRDISDPPAVCPKCKSPYWDRPRQNAIASEVVSQKRKRRAKAR